LAVESDAQKKERTEMKTRLSCCLLTLGACALPSLALAQPSQDDKAAAEALYEAGKTLLRTDVAAACDKFAASQELDPGVGTLLYLGACYERLGRVASAWAAFREAASVAHRSGQADREKTATERAARIEARVPKLLIVTASGENVPGLEVKRDQKVVPTALFGVPTPLDPGKHVIVADAPGKATWTETVELGEGESKTVSIPALDSDGTAVAAPLLPLPASTDAKPAPTPKPAAAPPTPAPSNEHGSRWASSSAKVGLGVGAVGLVTLGIGSYFGLRAMSKWDDAKQHCDGSACDQTGVDLHHTARVSGNVSTALFALGAVAVGTGIVLVLNAPHGKRETRVGAIATPQGAMVSLGGAL
jgi:hypothetical protein